MGLVQFSVSWSWTFCYSPLTFEHKTKIILNLIQKPNLKIVNQISRSTVQQNIQVLIFMKIAKMLSFNLVQHLELDFRENHNWAPIWVVRLILKGPHCWFSPFLVLPIPEFIKNWCHFIFKTIMFVMLKVESPATVIISY